MPHSFLASQGQFSVSRGPPLWLSRAFLWFRFRVQRPSYLHEASVWSPWQAHVFTCFAPELSLLRGRDGSNWEAFPQVARFTKRILYLLFETGTTKTASERWFEHGRLFISSHHLVGKLYDSKKASQTELCTPTNTHLQSGTDMYHITQSFSQSTPVTK